MDYMVMSGEVSIYKNMRSEAPIQLARLYKGDIFGEMALFDGSPVATSAEAIRLAVRKNEFDRCHDNPQPDHKIDDAMHDRKGA